MSETAEIFSIDSVRVPPTEGAAASETLETVLQELPGGGPDERLLVVQVERCRERTLVLRQQNRADGIGWFTQSSVEVQPAQLGPLRLALQTAPPNADRALARRPAAPRRLRIVS